MVQRKKYYIETFGCQMNEYDSALIEGILEKAGFELSDRKDNADYLFINTCSVREHAENRVFSLLSQYRSFKENKPSMKIALLGCMASEHRETLLADYPHLDYVIGPDSYNNINEILSSKNGSRLVHAANDNQITYSELLPVISGYSSYIAIARGCDNFCSYCIVPYVRGRERSRSFSSIISECEYLAGKGVSEIVLLGQNVNSYRYEENKFSDLIRSMNSIGGIKRIRFLTSHPKDLNDTILLAMRECDKAAPHLHLPFQSGSNRILKLMNRKYSREHYLSLIDKAREYLPDISLTTDIITGFPSETEDDFEATLDIVKSVKFDDAFTYKYSPRQGTKAAMTDDDVSESVKLERLDRLIKLVRKIAAQNLANTVGKEYTVLIERESKKESNFWMGKTEHNRVAVIEKGTLKPGGYVRVLVEGMSGFTLRTSAV